MRIATWNLNSVKARLPRLISWLELRQPDVLLAQETKAVDASWPRTELAALGYESAHLGTGRWNGVAALSRVGLNDITYGLAAQPTFEQVLEPRALGVTCGGIRLWTLYVPNGRSVGHDHYRYKLEFLAAVATQAANERAELGAAVPFGLLGDFNIAPSDADVWDIAAFDGLTHVSAPERAALAAIARSSGPHGSYGPDGSSESADVLSDLMPRASFDPQDDRPPYTFWEMRMLGFQKGRGMRIDLALANRALSSRINDVWVDRDARKGQGPSDHAPLVLDLN